MTTGDIIYYFNYPFQLVSMSDNHMIVWDYEMDDINNMAIPPECFKFISEKYNDIDVMRNMQSMSDREKIIFNFLN